MGELRLDGGKSGQLACQARADAQNMPSGGCKAATVPLEVERWYDFPGFGGYLGKVGSGGCGGETI